ncbi:helix-turn-helix domain-containing protein [Clostridium butyricum]|uniref:Transposase n=1 Tax=Clostridium butyricum E4 str. BoNT E BL5262 TaxID=632245 RepID=C4IBG5_CLOBU|nr:helix-turn-helix domain-containing protein [Clostridium butyricum]EEP56269.1 transposase [Clostridium butyricum E4 str. BoNT E BL5262]
MSKRISNEVKLITVKNITDNRVSLRDAARSLGVAYQSIQKWITIYKGFGIEGFNKRNGNHKYTSELKEQAVTDYLSGNSSLMDICIKYKIRSHNQLLNWILKYNSHNKLKASETGGINIMIKGRTTTYKERIEIIKYCIENENNYAETAEKYRVSYQQVYSWIRKYQTQGIEALQDGRGKRKKESEMSELEKLKAKNKLLEAENRRQLMEIEFLKKLDEVERRRF